MILCQMNNK